MARSSAGWVSVSLGLFAAPPTAAVKLDGVFPGSMGSEFPVSKGIEEGVVVVANGVARAVVDLALLWDEFAIFKGIEDGVVKLVDPGGQRGEFPTFSLVGRLAGDLVDPGGRRSVVPAYCLVGTVANELDGTLMFIRGGGSKLSVKAMDMFVFWFVWSKTAVDMLEASLDSDGVGAELPDPIMG